MIGQEIRETGLLGAAWVPVQKYSRGSKIGDRFEGNYCECTFIDSLLPLPDISSSESEGYASTWDGIWRITDLMQIWQLLIIIS